MLSRLARSVMGTVYRRAPRKIRARNMPEVRYYNLFTFRRLPLRYSAKEISPFTEEGKQQQKAAKVPNFDALIENAEKKSRHVDLKLVKVESDTEDRPVYKLTPTISERQHEVKDASKPATPEDERHVRGGRTLFIHTNISSHDLDVQIKKAISWADENYKVRVVVSGCGSGFEALEKVFTSFEEQFGVLGHEARFAYKTMKGCDLKFQIIPPKKAYMKSGDL